MIYTFYALKKKRIGGETKQQKNTDKVLLFRQRGGGEKFVLLF